MSISEQVKELRIVAVYKEHSLKMFLKQAADTIESLSEKLETANEELERWHTDKINDKIKNPFAWTSTLCCHNCDHKDEYIEELEVADMERSAEVCGGGWIPCENKMPEIGKPVLVCDKQGNVCIRAITCKIKGKKYWSQDKYDVVAWRPLPEPYHEP